MKQKGFTLIELLAVIVILAIIALIAVPVILNVIEKSKIGAAEQSAQGYVDAVEKQIVTNKVKNENLIEEGEYTKSQLDEKNVKIKGEITDVVLVVGEKGRVTQARFCINGYSIDYDGKKTTKNSEANYCNEMNSIVDTCPYEENQVFNFDYTGDVQEFSTQCKGNYKLEVWGASTNSSNINTSYATGGMGLGGYSVGVYTVNSPSKLYIYVGGQGNKVSSTSGITNGGWNGGGGVYKTYSMTYTLPSTGGGGTDISTVYSEVNLDSYGRTVRSTASYNGRIIVAGGGGGWGRDDSYSPGAGGGYLGNLNNNGSGHTCTNYKYGDLYQASQDGGGAVSSHYSQDSGLSSGYQGGFGYGATQYSGHASCTVSGGGGGGWYGGGTTDHFGGYGGSGYIGGVISSNGVTRSMYCYNCSISNNEETKTISTTSYSSTPTANYAKQGNGYARITYLGEE